MKKSTRSGQLITQPTDYKAFIPNPLPFSPPINVDEYMQDLLANANAAIDKLDTMAYLVPNLEHIIAMYIRKEALLSSQIEGTQATLEDIFNYECNIAIKNPEDVEEVVNYIKALKHGIHRLQDFPMSIRLIKEIHSILLQNTRGKEKTPGELRKSQNWIGPPGSNLKTATYIPPPPLDATKALGDLELYIHRDSKLHLLINCALIHYQFETIHPFLDGNGRVGRLLITFYLYWKKALRSPLLYLSYFLKIHRQEYYDRLNLARQRGDLEQWIQFFLKGILWTCESSLESIKNILSLQEKHKKILIQKRVSTPHAIALLDHLFEKPILSITEIAKHLSISFPTAKSLTSQFENLGLLKEITGKKRDQRFAYWEYLDLLSEGT